MELCPGFTSTNINYRFLELGYKLQKLGIKLGYKLGKTGTKLGFITSQTVKNNLPFIQHKRKILFTFAKPKQTTMKSSELIRIADRYGWKLSKQDGTSHREYEKEGRKIIIPFHGAREVPTGTCRKILKIIKRG